MRIFNLHIYHLQHRSEEQSIILDSQGWGRQISVRTNEIKKMSSLWQGDLNNLCERSLSDCTLNTAPWEIFLKIANLIVTSQGQFMDCSNMIMTDEYSCVS